MVYLHFSQMSDTKSKSKTMAVPVRMDSDMRARLDRAARRIKGSRNSVVRLAVHKFLPEIESGRIALHN